MTRKETQTEKKLDRFGNEMIVWSIGLAFEY